MPGRYTRERTRIGTTTIERVTRMMRTGTVPGAGVDIADEGTPGLILRVDKNFAGGGAGARPTGVRELRLCS